MISNRKNSLPLIIALLFSSGTYANYVSTDDFLWEKGKDSILSESEIQRLGLLFDQKKAELLSAEPYSLPTTIANEIGRGVNFINGERTRVCLQTPVEMIEVTDHLGKEIHHEIYDSYEQVDDKFESHNSIGAGGSYKLFSASASKKKALIRDVSNIKERTTTIVTINEKTQSGQYNGWGDLHSRPASWLNGSESGKVNFRNMCGDGYVDKAIAGRNFNLVIDVKSSSKKLHERQEVAKSVKAAFGLFGGGSASSAIEDLKQYRTNYSFDMAAHIEGSKVPFGDISLDNVHQKMVAFEQGDLADVKLVSFDVMDYFPPNMNDNPNDVFANYRIPLDKLEAWRSFMDENYYTKCKSAQGDFALLCNRTHSVYEAMEDNCSRTSNWSSCKSVLDPSCKLSDGSPCNALESYSPPPPPPQKQWHTIYSGSPTTNQITIPAGSESIRINGIVRFTDYTLNASAVRQCQGGNQYVRTSCSVIVNGSYVRGCYSSRSEGTTNTCNGATATADGRITKLEVFK